MKQAVTRCLNGLCVMALLLCCVVVTGYLFQQADMEAKISEARNKLETVQGRLRKQQQEYAEYTETLPRTLAELAECKPKAAAVREQEQALRQQRKELREENKTLSDEVAAIEAQVTDTNSAVSRTAEAIRYLEDALRDLQALLELVQ